MAAALVYTLPTLQLVCHLVATGNSTIVGTTPGTTPSPISALPNGYVAFPGFGVAYKIHREKLPWIEAKTKCAEEGGHLTEIDSNLKPEHLSRFSGGRLDRIPYTGIHLVNGVWRSDRTGLIVTNIPWAYGEPNGDGNCTIMTNFATNLLRNWDCDEPLPFVCRIRYP